MSVEKGVVLFWRFFCLFFPSTTPLVFYFIHVPTDFTLVHRNHELVVVVVVL